MKGSLLVRLRAERRLARLSSALLARLRPAIRLKTFPCREEALPLGATRIGGRPDLTDEIAWPRWRGQPLAFLAQINLSDLVGFPSAQILPNRGWLVFFYDAEQSTWGFDPQDRGSWAVLFMPDDGKSLRRRGAWMPYSPCRVEMSEVLTAPPPDSLAVMALELDEREALAYEALWQVAQPEVAHQLLGYPLPLQGDMQLECEYVSKGRYCGGGVPWVEEEAARARDWRLLFQLDTDAHAGMMWGDAGRLYFWIRQIDLRRRDFGRTWMILQCS